MLSALIRRAEILAESRWALLVPICLYLTLASARLVTNDPWVDEGWFASSAVNLVREGFMGNTLLATQDYPNLDRYTYWLPPLYFVTQSVVYRVAGVGLYQMRSISLIFGLFGLYAIYRLSLYVFKGSRPLTILALTLVATNFFYVKSASDGRMDMMAASLFLLGISWYLEMRERDLQKAILLGNVFICLSGLAHPNGLLGLIVLVFLVVYLDRNRIRLRSVLLGLLPYLIGGLAWGAYIAQDYDSFKTQLLTNTIRRQGGEFASGATLNAVYSEVSTRYLKCYGYVPGNLSLVKRTPAPVLAFYLLCFVGFPLFARDRSRLLWYILLIVFLGLMFIVGNKTCTYLVWITPLFLLNSIMFASCVAARGRLHRTFFTLAFGYVLLFSLASTLYVIAGDEYHRLYLHDIRAFNSSHYRGGLIYGSGELAFFYDFNDEIVQDDYRLGFKTGARPEYISASPIYLKRFERYREERPDLYDFVVRLLADEYAPVYEGRKYTFYEKLAD